MEFKKIKTYQLYQKIVIGFWLMSTSVTFTQSIVTDIIRDSDGNISTIEYYNTSSKKIYLTKLETYHPNGHISNIETFNNGLKNGLYQEFYSNGRIKLKGQYKNGDKSGLWTEYYIEGGVMRMYYSNKYGKNGSINEWYKNGERKINGIYSEGLKHGIWISWYSNGIKESMVTYNNGKIEGVFIFYYKNGIKKSEGVVNYTGLKDERCWDEYGNPHECQNVN